MNDSKECTAAESTSADGRLEALGDRLQCQSDGEQVQSRWRSVFAQQTSLDRLPSLVDVMEAARRSGVSVERIAALTSSGHMPAWFIDDGPPMYNWKDVCAWVAENLVACQPGQPFPRLLPVVVRAVDCTLPEALRPIAHVLREASVDCSGVYFLLQGDEVVYVGQSELVGARLGAHRREGLKEFDRAVFLPLPESELLRTETAFIRLLRPKYNFSRSARSGFVGLSEEDQRRVDEVTNMVCGIAEESKEKTP